MRHLSAKQTMTLPLRVISIRFMLTTPFTSRTTGPKPHQTETITNFILIYYSNISDMTLRDQLILVKQAKSFDHRTIPVQIPEPAAKEVLCSFQGAHIDLWDTAGIERFATLSASYFQSSTAAILCYSVDDRESFSMLSQHMLDIIMHSETAKIFLCGNKADVGETIEQVTAADLEDFQVQCDAVISGIYRTSCLTGDGVKEMFEEISRILHTHAELKFDPTRIQPSAFAPPLQEDKKKCCSST